MKNLKQKHTLCPAVAVMPCSGPTSLVELIHVSRVPWNGKTFELWIRQQMELFNMGEYWPWKSPKWQHPRLTSAFREFLIVNRIIFVWGDLTHGALLHQELCLQLPPGILSPARREGSNEDVNGTPWEKWSHMSSYDETTLNPQTDSQLKASYQWPKKRLLSRKWQRPRPRGSAVRCHQRSLAYWASSSAAAWAIEVAMITMGHSMIHGHHGPWLVFQRVKIPKVWIRPTAWRQLATIPNGHLQW